MIHIVVWVMSRNLFRLLLKHIPKVVVGDVGIFLYWATVNDFSDKHSLAF